MSLGRSPGGPRRRRASGFRRIPRVRSILLVLLGFILSGVVGALSFFWPTIITALGATGHGIQVSAPTPSAVPGSPSATPTTVPTSSSPFTVLLMGSDNDGKFTTSSGAPYFCCAQSLILVRVNPAAGAVTMLSIPRDLWVPIYSASGERMSDGKVSEAFGDAGDGTSGADAQIATIEQDFQVTIDHYVWIGLQGLINLIDEVGGIDIVASHPVMDDNYPYDVAGSTNPYAADRVAVLPGAQHLDGVEALQYVRSRHDDLSSDLGRNVRQQQVLVALRQKLSQLSLGDINNLASALSGEVLTDVPLTQFSLLLGISKDVGSGSIQHVYLTQYSPATVNGQDVLEPDMSAIMAVIHQYFPAS